MAEVNTDRLKLNLYREIEEADKAGDDRAKLEAYKRLQDIYISEESIGEKAFVYSESALQGVNKGILQTLGFPVDVANYITGLGETGVRKVLNEAGFDIPDTMADSKLMSKEPFLGSQSLNKIFNAIGINTEYDKSRAATAIIGRIGEEVGMSLPIGAGVATRAQKPLQFLSKEAGIATSAGVGAATAQQLFPDNVGAEITGQFIGGFTPISLVATVNKVGNKTGAKEAFNLFFRPREREKEIAGNILYQKLGKEKTAELLEEISKGEFTLFGEKIDSTKFPRLLNEMTNEPELATLLRQLEQSEVGMSLVNNIEASKLVRLLELENNFLKTMKKTDYGVESIVGATEGRVDVVNKYLSSRLQLAEQTAADKIQVLGGNVTQAQASALLRREIDDALEDALTLEKKTWSKVTGTIDGSIIEQGAAAILNNFYKTTDQKNIPKVLKDIVGDKLLIEAGLLDAVTESQTVTTRFGGKVQTETRQVPVEPKAGILTKEESIPEILNLRQRVYDEIRVENSKTAPSQEKLDSLQDLLGIIDQSFMDVGNAKNISELTQAISYSDKLKAKFFESEIGKIQGYNSQGGLKVIPENTYNKLIGKGDASSGVATKDVNNVLGQQSEGIQESLKAQFAQLADDDGLIPTNVLQKFLQNNDEVLKEFPELKAQFQDVDEALRIVDSKKANLKQSKIDTEKYRLQTMASSGGQSLSSKAIVTGIFNSKDPSREIGKIIKVASRDESGAALKGLQNEVSDFMIDQIKAKEIIIDGKSTFVPDVKRLNTFVNKNKDSLIEIYGEEGFKNIEEFQRVATEIDGALTAGGLEKLAVIAIQNVFVSSVGRILGTKVAALTGGPALVFAGIGGRVANALVANRSSKQIKALLANAFVDPDFAKTLLLPYVDNNQEVVTKAVNTFIGNAFQVEARDVMEDEQAGEAISGALSGLPIGRLASDAIAPFVGSSVVPESRLNTELISPVGMRGTPTTDTGAINPTTLARGQQLFSGPGEITFAAKGGIMNTKKAFQRVA